MPDDEGCGAASGYYCLGGNRNCISAHHRALIRTKAGEECEEAEEAGEE